MSLPKGKEILWLLLALAHVWCVKALSRQGSNPTLLVTKDTQSRLALESGAAAGLLSTLWSDLVIERAGPVTDFAKGDKAVKDKFVENCAITFDGPEPMHKPTEKAFNEECSEADGKAPECDAMTKDLIKAREDKKLESWCDKTFDWFAGKTKPRCLKKCLAYLCKDRCALQDQINDSSDRVAAYNIKLETVKAQKARADKVSKEVEATKLKIDKFDKEKCTPAGSNVTALQKSQTSIDKELAAAVKATSSATEDNDKAFDALKKAKADKKATETAKSAAEDKFNKAADVLKKARLAQSEKNTESKEMAGKVKYAQVIKDVQCTKLKDMKTEYDKDKKANDDAVKKVDAQEKNINADLDKATGEKKDLDTALGKGLKAA